MKTDPELEVFASKNGGQSSVQKDEIFKAKEGKGKICIEKGSINESVINLCIISFGIGLLALPQKVNYVTLLMIPFLIIICGAINYWTFVVLADASRKYKKNKYEDIVSVMFNPYFSYFFIIVMIIGLLGIMILFQVILYKFIGGIYNIRLIVCYSISIFILFPLCLIKTISKMRYFTSFGVFSVFLIIFIVVIQCPNFFYHNVIEGKQEINLNNFSVGFDKDLKFIQSISTIIFAFECHAGIFPAIAELNDPTPLRVNTVFKRAATINVISYIIITVAGYLSQPENTPDLVLEREKISKNDYLMTLGLFLFSITLTTKISASFNCLRALFLNLLKYDLNNYPNHINYIITSIILGLTTFTAAIFQNISDYISLISSFYGLFISVIMPGIIYIKGNQFPLTHYKNILAILFIVSLCFIGIITFYFTLKRIFKF